MVKPGSDMEAAVHCLQNGELIGIPTETVYGLAANALNAEAVAKIFSAKNRPFFDPLIVHIHDISEAKKYVQSMPDKARKLAEAFWPGPLTLVLPKKEIIPDLVTAGHETVGIRVPSHPVCLALLKQLDFPLAAPSANPFGYVSPTTAQHVADQLGNKTCYILDGGACRVGVESTIIGFPQGEPVIYRLGGIAVEQISAVIGPVAEQISSGSNPSAPGQLDVHYSPRCKVILDSDQPKSDTPETAYLRYSEPLPGIEAKRQLILSSEKNLEQAAVNLFAMLRQLDHAGYHCIVAELVPETGLGRAINDRLRRAAAK
ncbi:MAG: L-threonylcarbamoyladenylate synthase [Sphingomonadales bacterium]|jgi:L-threonylcarbamoyladenylate synthase